MKNRLTKLIGLLLLAMVLPGCVDVKPIPKGVNKQTAENASDTKTSQSLSPTSPAIVKVSSVMPSSSPNIKIDFSYSYRPKNGDPSRSLQNGDQLHSGDLYKIQFTPTENCYVYIFQYDSHNQLFALFPISDYFIGADTQNNQNPVYAGQTYFVPGEDRSFVLDEKVGTETIHFLVFDRRKSELESEYRALLQFRQQRNQAQVQVAQANISGHIDKGVQKQAKPDSKAVVKLDTEGMFDGIQGGRLECEGSNCVNSIRFEHLR